MSGGFRSGGPMLPMRPGQVYVGNLPPDVKNRAIEDLFYKFGKINSINLKNTNANGAPFAFIEFEDPRDADDAIRERDRYNLDGYSLRVELPRAMRREDRPAPRPSYGGSSYGEGSGGSRGSEGSGRSRLPPPMPRRTDNRIIVSGMPKSGSWQDLKDHFREAGEVCYVDMTGEGKGVVEFVRYDDMKYAVKKLDDSKLRTHEGETSYIRVKEDYGGRKDRGRSRSPGVRR